MRPAGGRAQHDPSSTSIHRRLRWWLARNAADLPFVSQPASRAPGRGLQAKTFARITDMDHAFVIPAYRESPFLEPCVRSLLEQTRPALVLITTSTPNAHIDTIARRYRVPVVINPAPPDIAGDWNFALTASSQRRVTIAHQDDLFDPTYAALVDGAFRRHPDALLVFTGFTEHDAEGERPVNANLLIKRLLTRRAFGSREVLSSTGEKRRLLAFGNPVCCPSVAFNRDRIPDFRFGDAFRSNLDWDAWERLAEHEGAFVHLAEHLVSHRVHGGTATTALIGERVRDTEDRALLGRFWRPQIAALLARLYRLSYIANRT